jgi:hypothetical protein
MRIRPRVPRDCRNISFRIGELISVQAQLRLVNSSARPVDLFAAKISTRLNFPAAIVVPHA